jgi:hypothetical protein
MKTPKTQRQVIDQLKVKFYNQFRKLLQKQMKELQVIYEKNMTEQLELKRQKILRKRNEPTQSTPPIQPIDTGLS